MEQLTPFRVTLPASLPASDRETLIASRCKPWLRYKSPKKDPIDAIFAVVNRPAMPPAQSSIS
ncbi:hypothetical protein [Kouleothrix sp.]|uniref:hypothetical protein n=1 Tax=Kouleothrix sp. TaxID=2779161 RepID=UPI00391A6F58